MAQSEHKFPTFRDLGDRVAELVEQGLGDHPVQIVIVPASTMRAIALASGAPDDVNKPPMMIELGAGNDAPRMAVALLSTEYLEGVKLPAIQ